MAALITAEREDCAKYVEEFGIAHPQWRIVTQQLAAGLRSRYRPPSRAAALSDPSLSALVNLTRTYLKLNRLCSYCDRCLGRELKISLALAQKITASLADEAGYERGMHWCRDCAEGRQVIRAL